MILTIGAIALIAILVATSLLVLKKRKPEVYDRLMARLHHPAAPAASVTVPPPSVAPATPPAAPSADGGGTPETPDVQPPETGGEQPQPNGPSLAAMPSPPAAVSLTLEESMMTEDKGVVTAGELLSGWVLANWDTKTEPVPAKRHADIMYLTQMAAHPGGNSVFEDVVRGSTPEVDTVRNYMHTNGFDGTLNYDDNGRKDWTADPRVDPDVKTAAEASIAATKAGWAARGIKPPTYNFDRYRRK